MPETRVSVIFISFGPYHFARGKALAETDGVLPFFIQLAESIATHPWQVQDRYRSSIKLITLSGNAYENAGYFQLCRRLWGALDEIDPAVVATSSFRPFIMLSAARWAKSRRRRAVLFFESTPWDRRRYRLIEAAKRALIRRYYDAAFAGGRVHRDYLVRLGLPPSRIWQPYDVVDNDHFATKAAVVRTAPERWRQTVGLPERYFLYVGRYSPEKNLCRLIEAYRIYRANCAVPWSLLLVGDGPQRSTLESLVSTKRLEGVVFKPFAQLDDLPVYYSLAECFVLPSTSDPWGLVVNEAMACSLPVLISRLCGCVPELVREGDNGLCFDPYDVRAIADGLASVSSLDENKRRQMGELSRTIISRFTPQTWAAGLAQCVRAILAENAS